MAIEDVLPRWVAFDCPDEQLHAPGILWDDEAALYPEEDDSLWSWTMRAFLCDDDGTFAVDEVVAYHNMNAKAMEWGISLPLKNQGKNVEPLPADLLELIVEQDGPVEQALFGEPGPEAV